MTFRSTSLLLLLLVTTTCHADPASTTTDPSVSDAATDPVTTTEAAVVPAARQKLMPNVCPSDVQLSSNTCSDTVPCTGKGTEVCYRDMTVDTNNKKDAACCAKLNDFCPITNMITKHHHGSAGYIYKYKDQQFSPPRVFDKEFYRRDHWDSSDEEGVACPMPYSYTLLTFQKSYDEKGLPVDFDLQKASSIPETTDYKLQKCTKNADCKVAEGEFCDAAYNPSFLEMDLLNAPIKENQGLDRSAQNGAPELFCYKVPVPEPNMNHVVDGAKIGLKLCNIHADCQNSEQVCHTVPNSPFRNKDNATLVKGVCMTVDSCDAKIDQGVRAVLNINSQDCNDDSSCQGAGVSAGSTAYNPHCREYLKSDPTRKLCCFEKNPPCRLGQTETPLKNCSTMFDCADPLKNFNSWCDDVEGAGPKYCCKDMNNRLWQCPDLRTPLFNEPKCEGVTTNINSGSCPKKGGQCLHGHCCPGLTINANASKTTLGKDLYKTEFPCDPKGAVPLGFSYSYCEPETKKIIVVGRFHENGDKMTKVSGSKCTISDDCAADGSQVCVYENDQTHVCYYNPLRPLRPEVSSFWKIVLIVSLSCGGVFLISTIVCFVCYRSKSVFDKYKKKDKKGKGKDGKSSTKSKSNSKESGKKGKGKKGKGKKGKGSGSSSSKKGDVSETGKSDMTDVTGKSQA